MLTGIAPAPPPYKGFARTVNASVRTPLVSHDHLTMPAFAVYWAGLPHEKQGVCPALVRLTMAAHVYRKSSSKVAAILVGSERGLTRRTAFEMTALSDPAPLQRFISAMEWFIEQVNKTQQFGRPPALL